MGSIAICVCPDDVKGDPFIACMKEEVNAGGDHNEADQQSSSSSVALTTAALPKSSRSDDAVSALTSSSSSSASSATPLNMNHFVTSFDIGSASVPSAHQARTVATSSINAVTTPHPPTSTTTFSSGSSSVASSERVPSIISASTSTTTESPYVFYKSSSRPATISSSNQHHHNHVPPHHQYQPESHRIPIISSAESQNYPNHDRNSYHQHRYPPMPITSSPYGGSSSANIFNEKTFAPISDFGMTNSYSYSNRGQSGHLSGSGSHHAYEYDSRPIAGTPSYNILGLSSSTPPERYGHHNYHPSSSGFPGPITEAPTSRYPMSDSSSYHGVGSGSYHHHSPTRNDLGSSHTDSFNRISDPLGKYESCRMVNGVVVCADNSNRGGESGFMHSQTTSNYGFHSSRDRDQFSSYYPIPSSSSRYPSSSLRPSFDYNYVNRRNGYPQHYEERQPIDNERTSYYPFPKEQRISTQIHTISSSSSSGSSHLPVTSRNDNDHHLCKSMCGINSVCRLVLERPVCGCPEGHTGDPSVRCDATIHKESRRVGKGQGFCERHVDCTESEICAKSKCVDPCKEQDQISTTASVITGDFSGGSGSSSSARGGKYTGSMCGTNAQCLVVGHTPLCKCNGGYFGNPYVACVP
ncbi:unnamed protein product [Orchesella dallaii]|uniref:EGF-like domain-containing protein n=1 Tax=Orchesella dallaii TaxID=48710 RepID=A0ABP1PX57_9HEXA